MIDLANDQGASGKLSGPVTLANARALLEDGNARFAAPAITLDLSGITEVDSAAVSLLLEWRRVAQRAKRDIRYVNYPENLKSLIQLYGVTELLS